MSTTPATGQAKPAGEPVKGGSRFSRLAKTVGPWLVALLAVAWIVRFLMTKEHPGEADEPIRWVAMMASFQHIPLAQFLIASVVLLWLNCAADSLAMYYTFRWFGCALPYRELFIVRAATYLLAVVQYYVGQAAILGFLHQRKQVHFWRAAGWILFISMINMGVLVLLASAGMVRADISGAPWLRWVPLVVGVSMAGYALMIVVRPQFIARISFLAPMFEMGLIGHVKATVVRVPHVAVLLLWHFLALRWFGIDVPPLVALVYLPVVFFFAALPVSIQGLGLSQWAAVTFFATFAPRGAPAVLAYSLAMTGVSLVIQLGMGFAFLRTAQRLGMSTTDTDDEAAPTAPTTAEGSRG